MSHEHDADAAIAYLLKERRERGVAIPTTPFETRDEVVAEIRRVWEKMITNTKRTMVLRSVLDRRPDGTVVNGA